MPADAPQTEQAVVQECLAVYHEYQDVIDGAVQGVVQYLKNPDGRAHVKALQGALADSHPTDLSADIARRITSSPEFGAMNAAVTTSGLATTGVGVSGNAYAIIGAAGGAEVLGSGFDHFRTWHAVELEILAGVDAGLTLSFWNTWPLTGCIFGLCIDVQYEALAIRFMLVRQRTETGTTLPVAGFSIQIGLGLLILPVGAGRYLGKQDARERERRFTLDVENSATDGDTIYNAIEATLDVTIHCGIATSFADGSTITIDMPSYFTSAQVENMSISLDSDAWSWAYDSTANTLVLTTNGDAWAENSDFAFTIAKVTATGETQTGYVKMTINWDPDNRFSNKLRASLDLADYEYSADFTWSTSTGAFLTTINTPTSGTGSGTTSVSGDLIPLTTATDKDGNTWNLGYILDYDASGNPQIAAAMQKSDTTAKIAPNYYAGVAQTQTEQQSQAAYKNTASNGSITVTATRFTKVS
jgi:hypothetical protein